MNILSGLMSPCRIPMPCRTVRARRMSATNASAEASAMNGWLLMMSSKVPQEYRGSTRKDVSVMMQALSTVTKSSCIQPMIMTEKVPTIQLWTVPRHNYVRTYVRTLSTEGFSSSNLLCISFKMVYSHWSAGRWICVHHTQKTWCSALAKGRAHAQSTIHYTLQLTSDLNCHLLVVGCHSLVDHSKTSLANLVQDVAGYSWRGCQEFRQTCRGEEAKRTVTWE